MSEKKDYVPYFIMVIVFSIPLLLLWGVFMGAPVFPETREITIANTNPVIPEQRSMNHIYCEIKAIDGNGYVLPLEVSLSKYNCANTMWNSTQTIKNGQTFKIRIWHSLFGGYVKDGLSYWNSNPKIDYIERIV